MQLKFQIGITDVIESDNFVYSETNTDDSVHYNILRQSSDDEKAQIEWTLDTSIPAVQNLVRIWEDTIRKPHLCMIGHRTREVMMNGVVMPDMLNQFLNIEFVSLFPYTKDPAKFDEDDLQHFCSREQVPMGDLQLSLHQAYEVAGYHYASSAVNAIHRDTTEQYDPNAHPVVIPYLTAEFELRQHRMRANPLHNTRWQDFYNNNSDALEVDYESFSKYKENFKVGSLIGDPFDAYTLLAEYPRVCRTSFVKVEE